MTENTFMPKMYEICMIPDSEKKQCHGKEMSIIGKRCEIKFNMHHNEHFYHNLTPAFNEHKQKMENKS